VPRRAVAVVVAKEERGWWKISMESWRGYLENVRRLVCEGSHYRMSLAHYHVRQAGSANANALVLVPFASMSLSVCDTTLLCVGHDAFFSVTPLIRLRGVGPGQCRFWWVRKPAQ